MMAKTRTGGREMQDEFLKAVRRSQDVVVGAITTAAGAVQVIAPKLPAMHLPFADRLPEPKAVVEGTYDFAEKLLADQRKFAERVLAAAKPLTPGTPLTPDKSNGHAAKSSGQTAKTRPATK